MSGDERSGTEYAGDRWNGIFQTLAAEPRRQIVDSLLESSAGDSLSLPEAANPPAERRDPEELRVELLHVHLPVLAEAGYVEWTREPFAVDRGPNFEEVAVVLEAVESHVDRVPPQLVDGCQRLEEAERRSRS